MEVENFDLDKPSNSLMDPSSLCGAVYQYASWQFRWIKYSPSGCHSMHCEPSRRLAHQNPFKSTYWAAQGMAAEMASGVIPMAYVRAANVPIRMILAGVSGNFVKMCKGPSTFTCKVQDQVKKAMQETLTSGQSVQCNLMSVGRDSTGDTVSEWSFEWSFRARLEEL